MISLVAVSISLVAFDVPAIAGNADAPSDDACTVGILHLTSQRIDTERLRSQTADRCQLIDDAEVRRRFADDGSGEWSAGDLDDLTEQLEAGIHDFYYEDAATALETLDDTLEAVEKRASNGHLDAQLSQIAWDAGVVMVRALQRTGSERAARTRAAHLVALFPTRTPEARKVPPAARQLIHNERTRLTERGATIRLDIVGGAHDCSADVNGIGAPTGEAISVARERSYRARANCGDAVGPALRVSVKSASNERLVELPAPLPDADGVTRLQGSDRDRSFRYFEAVANRANLDRVVVYVQQPDGGTRLFGAGSSERNTILATDLATSDYRQVLGQAFASQPARPASTGHADSRSTAGDWALVSSGAALGIGAGVYTAAVLLPRGKELACSPNNADPASGSTCDGVEQVEFDNREAFDAAVADFRLARGLTIGAAAVGVGLTSWGIWRLASRDNPTSQQSTSRIKLHVGAGPDRATIQLTGGF